MKKCAFYSVIFDKNNSEKYNSELFEKLILSTKSLRKHNETLEIRIYSNLDHKDHIKFVPTVKKGSKNWLTIHKHDHYKDLLEYDHIIFLDPDTIITKNIDYMFKKYSFGISKYENDEDHKRFPKDPRFFTALNTGVMIMCNKVINKIYNNIEDYRKLVSEYSDVDGDELYRAEEFGFEKYLSKYNIKYQIMHKKDSTFMYHDGDLLDQIKETSKSTIFHYFSNSHNWKYVKKLFR